jgi:hypothetical protein
MSDSPPKPSSVADVIDLLRSKGLLGEIGMTTNHAGTIKTRGRLPAGWITPIHTAAVRHELPISLELLVKLASGRAGKIEQATL